MFPYDCWPVTTASSVQTRSKLWGACSYSLRRYRVQMGRTKTVPGLIVLGLAGGWAKWEWVSEFLPEGLKVKA